jgi:hypothetical protein
METMNPYLAVLIGFVIGAVLGSVFDAFWGRKHPKLVSIAAAAAEQLKTKV